MTSIVRYVASQNDATLSRFLALQLHLDAIFNLCEIKLHLPRARIQKYRAYLSMADPQPKSNTNNTDKPTPTIQDFITPITTILSDQTLYELSYKLSKTYKYLAAHSTEQFFPTPITHLPTGKERGRYLAVYVGLFYLHVGFIELLGCDDDPQPHQNINLDNQGSRAGGSNRNSRRWFTVRRTLEKAWPIEERLKLEHPVEFFGWIGACIAEVVGDSLRNEQESSTNGNGSGMNNGEGYYYGVGEDRELVAGISFCFPIV